MRPLAVGGLVLVAVAGMTWAGTRLLGGQAGSAPTAPIVSPVVSRAVPAATGDAASPAGSDEVRVDGQDAPVDAGLTPMALRVAVIGLLNKRNGVTRDFTMKPGQAVRVNDVVIRLRACERTAPWEPETLTGAFVQLDVRRPDTGWKRVFSGWLYKERPALNVVIHPVYDVWAKSCTMTFPGTAPSAPAAASSAKKSPAPAASPSATEGEAGEADEAVEESAAPSNAT